MCKLTESNKFGDAEVDAEQEPELRPILVVAKYMEQLFHIQKNA
jgi:hypothetical protein